jgi:hypothetical protein
MFAKPTLTEPRKRLIAPASFSRHSSGALEFTGLVAGSDIVEDASNRNRRLKRPGTVGKQAVSEKELATALNADYPWYMMTKSEV